MSAKTIIKTVLLIGVGLIGGAKIYNTFLTPTAA